MATTDHKLDKCAEIISELSAPQADAVAAKVAAVSVRQAETMRDALKDAVEAVWDKGPEGEAAS